MVIVSASGSEVVEPIGDLLGADRVIATRMAVVDGHYSGEIEEYVYGEGKASAIVALADREGYDLSASFAYSDSITDLPMLRLVGRPHAVNPDRALRREALLLGWPILDFSHPRRLRTRVADRVTQRPSPGVAIGVAVLAAAVCVGLAWNALRRRDEPPA